MNDLLILLARVEEKHFLFLKYLLLNCDKTGFFEFNSRHYIFNHEIETPAYAIRTIGGELFSKPLVLKKSTINIFIRPISAFCPDSSVPYRVRLAQIFMDNISQLQQHLADGLIDNLRKLSSAVSINLYLSIKGSVELSEDEVRELTFDTKTVRFSNVVERKLKPSLIEINEKFGLNASYLRKKVEGKNMVILSIN